jgi:hypothetical protein
MELPYDHVWRCMLTHRGSCHTSGSKDDGRTNGSFGQRGYGISSHCLLFSFLFLFYWYVVHISWSNSELDCFTDAKKRKTINDIN